MQHLEKWGFQWIIDNVSPQTIGIVAVFILAMWLVLRVNKVVSDKQANDEEVKDNVRLLTKQQHKTQQLVSACPCVSKKNATWLQDPLLNGGAPPDPVICQFLEAKTNENIQNRT